MEVKRYRNGRKAVWVEPTAHAHLKELAARQRMQIADYIVVLIEQEYNKQKKEKGQQ